MVAGGAGFIGSYLCDQLVKTRSVICVDNIVTGLEENIDLLLQNPNFKFVRHDITQPLDLDGFRELEVFKVKVQGVQEIYNLACPTSPKQYNRLPLETLSANAEGTHNLLELAVRYSARFVHGSSAAIYGEPKDGEAFTEDYWGFIDPVGPRSCYNEGKRFAESLVTSYGATKGLHYAIARIFNTFGPRMKTGDGRMIPDFVSHALSGRPLIIYGQPESTSTFCYISDMVDGLVRLMESNSPGIFNLGSPEPWRVDDVAKLVLRLAGSASTLEFKEAPPFLARQGVPKIDKVKEALGWFPLVPLEEGLRQTIDYFKVHQNLLNVEAEGPV
ncbi:MAG: GDP-mannose 4,6-dehydratase [Candidatus Veblenbacteria bacterium]|nr:GDP-mannose 4,6-dehydratase [Candidatus Veblenbacteria bacterium]